MLNVTENLTILDALQSVTSFLYWLAAENGTTGHVDHRSLEADLGKRRLRIWTPSLLAQLVLQVPHLRMEVQQFLLRFFLGGRWFPGALLKQANCAMYSLEVKKKSKKNKPQESFPYNQ